jgi:hypothetical protein
MLHVVIAAGLLLSSASVPVPLAGQATEIQRAILHAVQGEMSANEVFLDPRILVWWNPGEHQTPGTWQIEFFGQHPDDVLEVLRAAALIQGTCEEAHLTGTQPSCDLREDQVMWRCLLHAVSTKLPWR